jgi:trimethylamine--corrinoid protein Co-methyltransferase
MKREFFLRIQPRISLLDEEHKEEIHRSSLEILERTGILVYDREALELLQQAGCPVQEDKRVFIPGPVVEEAIRTVPDRITISNRKGEKCLYLEDRKSYFGTGSETLNVIDVRTGERRKAILNDVREAAKVADYLKNVDFVMSMGMADDIPAVLSDRYQFEAMVSSTIKPIIFTAWDKGGLEDIYRMAVAVAGSEKNLRQNPFLINYSEPIAPFVHPKDSLQKLLFCAEKGIPVEYHCITMAGATGPATLAGSFVQANARMLSGMVIHQLKQKGAPLIVQSPVIFLDMKTSLMPYFGPDWVLSGLLSKEMALYYGIPTFGKAGVTDSKVLDQQAGIEIGMSLLAEGLVGNNLIHDLGYLEMGLTSSLASIVICDEVVSQVKRILRGVDFSGEHLAVESIVEAGPDGNFLGSDHTVKHFRQEAWFPKLFDRNAYDNWTALGGKTLLDNATDMAKSILVRHEIPALPTEVTHEMKSILQSSEEKLNKKQL